MTVLTIAVITVLAVFAVRLVWVQVVHGPAIAADARTSRLQTISLLGTRGQITDVHGVALATSVERYNVSVNQKLVDKFRGSGDVPGGVEGVATVLAPMLGMSEPELGGMLVGDRGFKYVKKGVLPEVAREIRALKLPGVNVDPVADRVYPNGALAGNLLGFVNSAGAGLEGLEASLDKKLTGTPGSEVYESGAHGQAVPGGYSSETPATTGESVRLTIDRDVQYKAEAELASALKTTGASSGSVVVMNPKTGELLALADSGAVDPNHPGDSKGGSLAASVSNVFEPGSTGKVITMSAALDNGIVTPTSQFKVPDTYRTANHQPFHDSHEHATLKLTTTGILAESSNTGTVMIGEQLTKQQRYAEMRKFGFGTKTGVELPGESPGLLKKPDLWDGRTQYTVLFGQGVAVNAIQATQVYATIANGGVRVQPHVIAGWTAADGTYTPAAKAGTTRVVSKKTADTVLTMLESVVDDEGGTGSSASIPGYRVAGKTGTAQNWIKGKQGITASFIGAVPADDPAIVVSVILHNPKSSVYGGTVAAPVFKDVASYTLGKLGIEPSGTKATRFPTTW
ncbi:penicillin-binding protein 2 [Cellulomonas sp. HZM]|uniref:peptidoglycan D,D-transpeptidase FtsI family protein n=1 Tax=Cellulomonas sp. HZM TaxID=1454010 RepID=UPI000554E9A0|nr:penicillin-binding protein 2 [Cellulomonas sp. HZM]